MQRLAPGIWRYAEEGDKTFGAILQQIARGIATDAVLMVGDQIYADNNFAEVTDEDLRVERYFELYRASFSQPKIRALMAQIPTYMTLDDHEITDNWPNVTERAWQLVYPAAMQAYETYQLSHSPLFPSLAAEEKDYYNGEWGNNSRLWYTFTHSSADFFVGDCRTERQLGTTPETRAMLSPTQLEALKKWLSDGSGRVKIFVSSVPFFPDKLSGEGLDEDKWGGFLKQRSELLDFIFDRDLKRVVFLAGDVACGMTSELRCPEKPNFKVISIVSSGLFWPFPHGKAKKFQMEGKLAGLSAHSYQLVDSGPIVSVDHFTRVTTDLNSVTVETYSSTGKLCTKKVHTF